MFVRITHIALFLFCAKLLFAQDAQFSQPYAAPLYLNPAFTGDTKENRLSFSYRKQWAKIDNGFTSYIASFDHYKEKMNSGFGAYILYDQAGTSGYRVTGVNFSYSYDARINRWSGIKGGLSLGYSFVKFNENDLLFADQIISGSNQSIESNLVNQKSYLDMGAGFLYYNKFVWLGVAVNHLNMPNISMMDQIERLPMKFSIHGGFKVWNKRNQWGKEMSSLNLLAHYKFQADWDQLDIGAYFNFLPVIVGVWYRGIPLLKSYSPNYSNHESLILLIGLEYKDRFRIGYSYDFTISELSMSSGGSHEITLIYEWPENSKNSRSRKIACPKF